MAGIHSLHYILLVSIHMDANFVYFLSIFDPKIMQSEGINAVEVDDTDARSTELLRSPAEPSQCRIQQSCRSEPQKKKINKDINPKKLNIVRGSWENK